MNENPSGKTSTRAGYHHGDLRRTLVRIARDQIAENGAHAVSLASLARLAGVSQPAPYRHFADRDALLEAVATEGFEEFAAALTAAAGGRDGAVKAMAFTYVAFGEANIELYRLMFASRLVPDAGTGSALETAAVDAFNRLRGALSATTPADRVDDEAHLIWAQLHGLVMLKADGHIRRPLAELVEVSSLLNPS
ncbi:TetR/AcrR family transcriptional regulator [Paraburkholderia hospita]|jgi:AcrR family transcriptional regulator|uniref:TetR family transcriptional regulator n=1 Tax=Paraburkholderia hospita TaxID=169430 RepID=A0AAN1JE52_9BURK|nr:TetR/AcrR family transcriptional regulator [Paraburkholderia hospita]AUT71222.1 TetR family transcriptional regulator [Paraburkholderia hospita]OUL75431.1 TetR family transcriptional regulator [Paraburkholderia hospita]SEI26849.1 transcriptional regulator, TetR family [Paraburkholderia hospita]